MSQMTGDIVAKKVKEKFPHIKILALSMSGEGQTVNKMIDEAGISGYALKNISKEELTEALITISNGGLYFNHEILEEMKKASEASKPEPVYLTIRELEIIKLIEKELSNKEIAAQLFISERTVETHRKNIFRKTKKNSVIGLIKYAYDHNIL